MGTTKKVTLSNALFSKVQQRVLGLLFSMPDNDFFTKEIIRLSESGSGAVQRELYKLHTAGLITVKKLGNQRRYQANRSSPLFNELHSIAIKTFGLADIIANKLKPMAKKIRFAFIYGSVAKQEDTAASDIDIMLIGDNITYAEIYPPLEKCQKQLHRPINPTIYPLKEWIEKRKNNNHFLNQVMSQTKIFIIGNENELKELGESSQNRQIKKRS